MTVLIIIHFENLYALIEQNFYSIIIHLRYTDVSKLKRRFPDFTYITDEEGDKLTDHLDCVIIR